MKKPLAIVLACAALGACATTPRQTATAPTVALPPAPPPGEPVGIVGLTDAQVRLAFGAPAFVRKDGNDQMWRYDGAACKAFFFLYPQSGTPQVRHVETVPRGRDIAADISCLDAIRGRPTPVS